MSKMTKAQIAERDEAVAKLHEYLKPGSRVTTILRHVSQSGMQRSITLAIAITCDDGKLDLISLDYWAARALGYKIDQKNGGVKIGGAGMDMGFQLVYQLGQRLWPNGTPEPHSRRNGQPDSAGGYALKHSWL
jgi:hypothetical protein